MIESLLLDAFIQSLAPAVTEAAAGAATEAIAAPMISEAVMGGGAAPMSLGQETAAALGSPQMLTGDMGLDPSQKSMSSSQAMSLPQASMGAAMPAPSFGQQVGDFANQAMGSQMQPAMNLYNQVTAPGASMGDMARSGFEYSLKSDKDPQNQVTIPAMSPMNPYANMANNTVGGIPSLLQNTQSGLLPFFGAR